VKKIFSGLFRQTIADKTGSLFQAALSFGALRPGRRRVRRGGEI